MEFSLKDQFIIELEALTRVVSGDVGAAARLPQKFTKHPKNPKQLDRALSIECLKVNQCGEICAQALYRAQALATQHPELADDFLHAADEEIAHLTWCNLRLEELESQPSCTGIFWYIASFMLGLGVGKVSDAASLGFVEHYERMVAEHLQSHLDRLQSRDPRTSAIFAQMLADELEHADHAQQSGSRPIPTPLLPMMKAMAHAMKTIAGHT